MLNQLTTEERPNKKNIESLESFKDLTWKDAFKCPLQFISDLKSTISFKNNFFLKHQKNI